MGTIRDLFRHDVRCGSPPLLANEDTFNALKGAIAKLKHWRVVAAMLMPNHLDVIVAPTQDRDSKLGNFSGAFKRWMRQALNASWNWQAGCFDRLRSESRCTINGSTSRKIPSEPG
jgi:hypothetical protein